MGIPSSFKLDWALNFLTHMLHSFSSNSVAIVLMPNRSSAGTAGKDKDNAKDRVKSDSDGEKMSDCKDESDDDDEDCDQESELRTCQWGIECKFAHKSRALKVRNFQLIFDKQSIYGARDAVASGLLVVSSKGENRFMQSELWRLRAILGVPMLSRDKMQKPIKRGRSGIPTGSHFTDVQERRQWYSGADLVTCVVNKVVSETSGEGRNITIIDCHQYDGSTACAAIEMGAAAGDLMSVRTASICHDQDAAQFSADKVAGILHTMAKTKRVSVAGFPDFEVLQNELRSLKQHEQDQQITLDNQLKVCVSRVDGSLLIMDIHRQRWQQHETYKSAMQELVDEHNGEFNTAGCVEHEEEPPRHQADEDMEPAAKKLKNGNSELPPCQIKNYQQLVNEKPDMPGTQLPKQCFHCAALSGKLLVHWGIAAT